MARQNVHIQAGELFSAYLDNQASASERLFLEQHLAGCADCRAQLEVTRAMQASLRALPLVKAPRSFVLPREMARQPRRSILTWYPALRLATTIAVVAFIIVFAGDVLLSPSGGSTAPLSIPAAAPAPRVAPRPELALATESPSPAATESTPAEARAASMMAQVPSEAAPPAAGAAANTAAATTMPAVAAKAAAPTAPPEGTLAAQADQAAYAASPSAPEATPAESVGQSTAPRTAPRTAPLPEAPPAPDREPAPAEVVEPQAIQPTPVADPWRLIAVGLLGLAIALGVATFIAYRKQV